jgi:cation diffusion facilitator family transporter
MSDDAAPGRQDLHRYAWLSIGAAVATISLKLVAYRVTGSVGLLSDALESVVNLVAAVIALFALRVAATPPDHGHPHGHDKAEYFASGAEGGLIFAAAALIVASAVPRLLVPRPIETAGFGLAVNAAASVINLVVARVLIHVGRTRRSIALQADGRHLMTDVWTSVGVLVGVAVVAISGIDVLDPIVAILVALHILWVGFDLVRRSARGLMDPSLPAEEQRAIESALDAFRTEGIEWHALRTRQSGERRFVSLHVLVPGDWTVTRAHDLAERLEAKVREISSGADVVTHLEPLEDPRAWADADAAPRAGSTGGATPPLTAS